MTKSFYPIILLQLMISCVLASNVLAQTSTAALLPLQLDYSAPASYLIEDIQVTGANSIDPEAIIAIAGLQAGDTVQLPGPAITDAIQRVWKQELVQDVAIYAARVASDRVILTISITESPRLLDYFFEGVKKGEQEKLTEKISLVKGKIVTEELIKDTQQTIQNYWIEEGYLNATVNITSLPAPAHANYIQLKISIEKGEKLLINEIHFKGNQQLSSKVLKAQMKHIRERPRFTLVKDVLKQLLTLRPIRKEGILWRPINLEAIMDYAQEHVIFFSSKFEQAKFEEDKQRILAFYQCKGFRDAKVIEATVQKYDKGLVNVSIQVEEGPQYRIRDIRWAGNHLYDDDTLSQILNIRKGDIYNLGLIHQKLNGDSSGEDVASLYTNDGYLFFHANPVEIGIEENTVDLEIRIQEGPQAHINKVIIEGNRWTHDHVIRRELRTLPGDKFSRAKVQRSYRELSLLNIFDPAIDILPIANLADGTVDIKYKVQERPKFEAKISLALGGGKQDSIGALTLATNNFSLGNIFRKRLPIGEGQTASLVAESNGKEYKNFALQFTEPWLFGKKPKQLHLSFNKSFEGNTGSMGLRASLGTGLTWPDDYTVLRSGIAYYRHNYTNYDLLENGKELPQAILDDLTLNFLVERNSTDSPIYPKQGSKLALHTSVAPPRSWPLSKANYKLPELEKYQWKEYHQWMLDGSYFLQLVGDLVLNMRGHFGLLGGFSSQRGVGPFERFYLGGQGLKGRALRGKENVSLRGYDEEYITPKDETTGYKGGVIYDKFALELRYPILNSSLSHIYVLGFAEGGNTWAHYRDYTPWALKKSVGVGIRLHLPFLMSTVRFDWGYGFDKILEQGESNELNFQWSVGTDMR